MVEVLSSSDAVRVPGSRTAEQALDLTFCERDTEVARQAAGGGRRLRGEAPRERLWPHRKASIPFAWNHAPTEPSGGTRRDETRSCLSLGVGTGHLWKLHSFFLPEGVRGEL